jgi:hypothetical protein
VLSEVAPIEGMSTHRDWSLIQSRIRGTKKEVGGVMRNFGIRHDHLRNMTDPAKSTISQGSEISPRPLSIIRVLTQREG